MRPAHESLLLQLTEQEYNLWRHHPITAAYLRYLGDQAEAFRTAAADLLEAGNLDDPSLIRGRILTLRELQSLSLDDIRNSYRQEGTEETSGTATD
jgi:hypothetical protein